MQEIRVRNTDRDAKGEGVLHEVKRTIGIPGLTDVKTTKVYRLEGATEETASRLAESLFCEEINQEYTLNAPLIKDTSQIIEVAYKPGVMNPEAESILKAAKYLDCPLQAADSSTEYAFYGEVDQEDIEQITNRLLVNKTVERIVTEKPETLRIYGEVGHVNIVSVIEAKDEQLMALSKDKLFLSLEEMKVIQAYFGSLGRNPTDCELEIIAARWSEHCGHKSFNAELNVDGVKKPPLFKRIKEASRKYFKNNIISAYEDNSGVMKFYEGWAICGKVETHNSPSAIEPYGGAMTGSGGVFRDPMGTGQGAKVIISTDIFGFAPPDLDANKLPPGCLHPDYLQRRVVEGVRDYGNRMGIPTNNGSVHFHEDFRAKPTIIVGAYGIMPEQRAQKGKPEVNDLIVVLGGKTGRDGIHGATFSSGEMTDRTINVNSSAVQIGNAIEEKGMVDALLECRDKDLIRAITDCGAAGFSSAIGELGEDTGVTVDIEKAPLKYPGLSPWEIWLSESQERMATVVTPDKIDEFLRICGKHSVEATVLGYFDGSNKLNVNYGNQKVAELDYDFLKYGLPQRLMQAKYEKQIFEESEIAEPLDWVVTIKKILSHGNVCSKEPIVRQYDHGVQGTNALPPFAGVHFDGPQDGVVITPILGKPYGMVVSHGMNPILNRIDPYWGSVWATAEALSNYAAVGGNYKESALINNYIWPFPNEEYMGALDRCVDAVVDCIDALETPVISGKDSLSSTYRGKNGEVINIPPVLCMSVFGKIPDVAKTVSSDIKKTNSTLCLVGKLDKNMGGSTYYDINGIVGNAVPKVDLKVLPKVFECLHEAINDNKVLSCHDVSEGGIITAVAEMCFGGDCGVDLSLNIEERPDTFLFNETAGCFVIEVESAEVAHQLFGALPHMILGKTKQEKEIKVNQGTDNLFNASVDELKQAWQEPMRKIFS